MLQAEEDDRLDQELQPLALQFSTKIHYEKAKGFAQSFRHGQPRRRPSRRPCSGTGWRRSGRTRPDPMEAVGRRFWAIAEGYIPGWSHRPAPDFTSHDAGGAYRPCLPAPARPVGPAAAPLHS